MLDDMLDYVAEIRQRPVWQPAPPETEAMFQAPLPLESGNLEEARQTFLQHVLPFAVGNAHPGFMGWVHGGGSVVGMLADMMAAGLNANLGGRDHVPIAVEQQVTAWMQQLFEFPKTATGLFVTGSSMANFIGTLVARTYKIGTEVRGTGMAAQPERLTAYTSADAHGCIAQALELAGIGAKQLRKIPVNERHQIGLDQLEIVIEQDKAQGYTPFLIVGTAGTVDVGAVDDLAGLANIADRHQLWFHVDGACGALGMLSPIIGSRMRGIQLADSIALDFHKWGQVPYDAGYILVREGNLHYETFASPAAYLRRESRGMAAGSPWPCDFGPDLSRSFKALKVWFTFQVYGAKRLGAMMEHTCQLAAYLAERIEQQPELELLAPVTLNIVCFRYLGQQDLGQQADTPEATGTSTDRLNAEIIVAIQESGVAAPSTTTVNGHLAIRAALFNHRTTRAEIDQLLELTLRFGKTFSSTQ
jgi:aromatic-L-amino-acid/L-tryptophan decarboxylase